MLDAFLARLLHQSVPLSIVAGLLCCVLQQEVQAEVPGERGSCVRPLL